MSPRQNPLTIGRMATALGVNVETIRFYQRKGLVAEPERPMGGIRRYGPADVARIKFIKAAQRLGFRLEEVRELLRLEDGMQCRAAAKLASRHLAEVRERGQDLKRVEAALTKLLRQCARRPRQVACPLIAALNANGEIEQRTSEKKRTGRAKA